MEQITFGNYTVTTCNFFVIIIHYVNIFYTGLFWMYFTMAKKLQYLTLVHSWLTYYYLLHYSRKSTKEGNKIYFKWLPLNLQIQINATWLTSSNLKLSVYKQTYNQQFYQSWVLLHMSVVSWLILFLWPKGTSPMFNQAVNQFSAGVYPVGVTKIKNFENQ